MHLERGVSQPKELGYASAFCLKMYPPPLEMTSSLSLVRNRDFLGRSLCGIRITPETISFPESTTFISTVISVYSVKYALRR